MTNERTTRLLSTIIMLIWSAAVVAQIKVSGVVKDGSTGGPLASATVVLVAENGRQVGETTDQKGAFSFAKVEKGKYNLKISFLGYASFEREIAVNAENISLGDIRMNVDSKQLAEVNAVAEIVSQEQRGDTVIFNAAAFKVNPDATTEDLIKKMPGMQVQDGKVTHAGETVRKVLVDGEEFFGSDPMIALRTIDANMVDKIEVYDKQSDQAEFTGFSDGNEERTINILTKMGIKKGAFGRVWGGYGTDEHYDFGGNVNLFAGQHRLSLIGMTNDVNKQDFSFDDVTGAMAGGGRGMSGSFGGGRDGLNKFASTGVNYNYNNKNKLKIAASYFYNYNKNRSNSSSLQEYFSDEESDSVHIYDSHTNSHGKNYNHRANMRINWTINSNNSLVFDPNISWQRYDQQRVNAGEDLLGGMSYRQTAQSNDNETTGYGLNGNLTFRHRFGIPRRTISLRVGASVNNSDADGTSGSSVADDRRKANNLMTSQISENDNRSSRTSASLVYTEPFGEKMVLQVNYSPSYSHSSADKRVMADSLRVVTDEPEFDNYRFSQMLSNKKNSDYWQHRAGVGLNIFNTKDGDREGRGEGRGRFGGRERGEERGEGRGEGRGGNNDQRDKWRVNATIGLDFQNSTLDGDQTYPYSFDTHKSYNSVLPSAELRIRKNRSFNLRVNYRTSTNAPSINNFQRVVDVSNLRRYSAGNPDLDQSLTHQTSLRMQLNNVENSHYLTLNTSFSATRDYIATSTVIAQEDSIIDYGILLPKGTQFNKPINMNGSVSSRINLTLSSPVKWLASNVNFNFGANLHKSPSMYNYRKVENKTYSLSGGINIGSNISENIDFNVKYDASYNIVKSTQTVANNYNYYRHNAGADLTVLFAEQRFVVANHINHSFTSGMGENYDANYLTWNASVGYKFFRDRRAELRLTANDLLDNAESVRRSIQDAYIQTSTTDVLKRYLILTFTYKFKGFGDAPEKFEGGRGGRGGRPDGFGGPPMM